MADTVLMGKAGGPLAWLVVIRGPDEARFFNLSQSNNLGREGDCQIRLSDTRVSQRHACIRYEHGNFVLHDLASLNRTYLNGQIVGAPHSLVDGDVIRVGESEMVFKQAR